VVATTCLLRTQFCVCGRRCVRRFSTRLQASVFRSSAKIPDGCSPLLKHRPRRRIKSPIGSNERDGARTAPWGVGQVIGQYGNGRPNGRMPHLALTNSCSLVRHPACAGTGAWPYLPCLARHSRLETCVRPAMNRTKWPRSSDARHAGFTKQRYRETQNRTRPRPAPRARCETTLKGCALTGALSPRASWPRTIRKVIGEFVRQPAMRGRVE